MSSRTNTYNIAMIAIKHGRAISSRTCSRNTKCQTASPPRRGWQCTSRRKWFIQSTPGHHTLFTWLEFKFLSPQMDAPNSRDRANHEVLAGRGLGHHNRAHGFGQIQASGRANSHNAVHRMGFCQKMIQCLCCLGSSPHPRGRFSSDDSSR